MIHVKLFMIVTFCLLVPVQASAISPAELSLIGQGEVRYLGFIKVYEASLYGDKNVSLNAFYNYQSSRCLKLDYKVELSVENFVEAAESILADQRDKEDLSSVRPQIDLLHSNYKDVRPGDYYTLCYDQALQETSLNLNGKNLVSIKSAAFAEVYFGIWLDRKAPLSTALRDNLISGLNQEGAL